MGVSFFGWLYFFSSGSLTISTFLNKFILKLLSFQVIPPFNEENYEHDEIVPSSSSHDSEFQAFSSARAIPSKSGLGSLVYEDALLTKEAAAVESADVAATSRQSKKAPLPHHYEPSTIAGITIGAFLLIFIGTGNNPFSYNFGIFLKDLLKILV